MAKSERDIQNELERLNRVLKDALAADANVRELLAKADVRRVSDGARRWDDIIGNLERSLRRTKSSITAYQQDIKRLEQQQKELRETGVLRENLDASEIETTSLQTVEQFLAIPLAELSHLTLEEVSQMHDRLMAAPEPVVEREEAKQSRLDARIEHARQTRQAMASSNKRPGPGTSFADRRKMLLLRTAVTKIAERNYKNLSRDETDTVLAYHGALEQQANLGDSDLRLKNILDAGLMGVRDRHAELRRIDLKKYSR